MSRRTLLSRRFICPNEAQVAVTIGEGGAMRLACGACECAMQCGCKLVVLHAAISLVTALAFVGGAMFKLHIPPFCPVQCAGRASSPTAGRPQSAMHAHRGSQSALKAIRIARAAPRRHSASTLGQRPAASAGRLGRWTPVAARPACCQFCRRCHSAVAALLLWCFLWFLAKGSGSVGFCCGCHRQSWTRSPPLLAVAGER